MDDLTCKSPVTNVFEVGVAINFLTLMARHNTHALGFWKGVGKWWLFSRSTTALPEAHV